MNKKAKMKESKTPDNIDIHEKTDRNKPEGKKVPESKKNSKKLKPVFIVEHNGNQFSEKYITELFLEEWKKTRKLSEIERLSIFFKVEEDTAYCLVNDTETIAIKLLTQGI